MKLKNILFAFFVLTAVQATAAPSGSNFQGVDLGAGLAVQNSDVYAGGFHYNDGYTGRESFAFNTTNINANFNAGVNFQVDPQVIIGLQAALQPIGSGIHGSNGQIDQRYDFSILPGFLITPDTLVYGKVGYSFATGSGGPNVGNVGGSSVNLNGFVVGAGVKSFVYPLIPVKNLYGFAEYNYAGYDAGKLNVDHAGDFPVSVNTNSGIIGVGYVFNVF